MRVADGMLALPALPLLVVLAAVDTGRFGLPRGEAASDIARLVAILTLFGWMGVARLTRAAALTDWRETMSRPHASPARARRASCCATSRPTCPAPCWWRRPCPSRARSSQKAR